VIPLHITSGIGFSAPLSVSDEPEYFMELARIHPLLCLISLIDPLAPSDTQCPLVIARSGQGLRIQVLSVHASWAQIVEVRGDR
jgi:hypothetical protein